jgi:Cof subfamily protein (haloacid dehalogenase superfamily)
VTPLPPYRLVATDLDGTIVRTDGSISARTVAALAAVERAGAEVVFVTGRPPRWLADVAEATGHRGLAICANGAIVYDLHAERVLATNPVAMEAGLEVVRRLRAALPGASFAIESAAGFAHEPGYRPRWDATVEARVDDIERLWDGDVVKLLIRHENHLGDDLLAKAREIVGDLAELTHSNSRDSLVEVSASGVSKASTLATVAEQRGLSAADVLAFGDMPNDLPMLAWAGTAYAMGNAHPEVLAAVDRRTASNDEDGVARVLELLFGDAVRTPATA